MKQRIRRKIYVQVLLDFLKLTYNRLPPNSRLIVTKRCVKNMAHQRAYAVSSRGPEWGPGLTAVLSRYSASDRPSTTPAHHLPSRAGR